MSAFPYKIALKSDPRCQDDKVSINFALRGPDLEVDACVRVEGADSCVYGADLRDVWTNNM